MGKMVLEDFHLDHIVVLLALLLLSCRLLTPILEKIFTRLLAYLYRARYKFVNRDNF